MTPGLPLLLAAERELLGPGRRRPRDAIGPAFGEVLLAAQLGADWAWERLYRSLAGGVYGYVRALGSSDPEGVVGDVFLSVARDINTFAGTESGFRSWVFVVAHRRVIDARRQHLRRPSRAHGDVDEALRRIPGGDVESDALHDLALDDARALLAGLSAAQRDVLLLRFVADMSLEDVARATGRPVTAVKALQRRGLAAIRRRLEREGYPGADGER